MVTRGRPRRAVSHESASLESEVSLDSEDSSAREALRRGSGEEDYVLEEEIMVPINDLRSPHKDKAEDQSLILKDAFASKDDKSGDPVNLLKNSKAGSRLRVLGTLIVKNADPVRRKSCPISH